MDLREVQVIELFHVAFLDALQQRLERGRWILKGGANLRYFFGSQRYSQDIDLDFLGDAPWGVREKVGEVIESPVLSNLLRVKGLSVGESNEHKQSDTTRRWKIGIAAPGHGELVRTKVEAFNDHVRNFLEPELRDYYDSEERWVQMQTFVAEKLEAAR